MLISLITKTIYIREMLTSCPSSETFSNWVSEPQKSLLREENLFIHPQINMG